MNASWTAWWRAARPATLSASYIPIAVGSACAWLEGSLHYGGLIATLGAALCIQIGTNFVNDLADYLKGADNNNRVGPPRAVQSGWLSPQQMQRACYVAFGLALCFGIYLSWLRGWPIVLIGLLSIAAGIAYTAGPYPLAYLGIADVFVFVFFGLVAVCGTAYVHLDKVPWLAWWLAIPVGLLNTAILAVNNLRDQRGDALAHKRTLVVRFGQRFGRLQYASLLGLSYVTLLLLAWHTTQLWWLIPLLSLPYAVLLIARVNAREGKALAPLLGATAKLSIVFSALMLMAMLLMKGLT